MWGLAAMASKNSRSSLGLSGFGPRGVGWIALLDILALFCYYAGVQKSRNRIIFK
jgi:hypothetical protein